MVEWSLADRLAARLDSARALMVSCPERTAAQPAASEHLPAELLRISSQAPEPHLIEYAAGFIERGSVIGIPTDTFYGLSADPFNLCPPSSGFFR